MKSYKLQGLERALYQAERQELISRIELDNMNILLINSDWLPTIQKDYYNALKSKIEGINNDFKTIIEDIKKDIEITQKEDLNED